MEQAYRNLGYFLILLVPLTFLAFFHTYFKQFPNFEDNITTYIHLHAIIATVWILMLIVQPILINKKKYKAHQKIGKISYLVFPLLILSFTPQMMRIINSDNPAILFFPLADTILLSICYCLAIYYRKKTNKHMRYMIGTAIVFLGPTIGRIGPIILGLSQNTTQNIQYGVIFFILGGLILLDRRNNQSIKPYSLILLMWVIHLSIFHIIF